MPKRDRENPPRGKRDERYYDPTKERVPEPPPRKPAKSSKPGRGKDPKQPDFTPEVLDKTVIAIPLLQVLDREDAERAEEAPDAAERANLRWRAHAVIIDLNLEHEGGREGARRAARELIREARVQAQLDPDPTGIDEFKSAMSDQYLFARLEGPVIRWLALLVRRQNSASPTIERAAAPIYRIWPDFPIRSLTNRSTRTVKADAARSSFAALGESIVWAVVDSGIDAEHLQFYGHRTLVTQSPVRHFDFTNGADGPLVDKLGHGTHVAGILAGEYTHALLDEAGRNGALRIVASGVEVALDPALNVKITATGRTEPVAPVMAGEVAGHARVARTIAYRVEPASEAETGTESGALDALRNWTSSDDPAAPAPRDAVVQHIAHAAGAHEPLTVVTRHRDEVGDITYESAPVSAMSGMAPRCKLVSMKVLDEDGHGGEIGESSNIIAALEQIQRINGYGRRLLIHGVNLSVGYDFQPEWFACGQSPLCVEVDRLVKSGVVVVVAAGNTGYGKTATEFAGLRSAGMSVSINDPGNADLAITVGSTHRFMPHVYGVSYFSSKGPTGDGRPKPDIVAPGEKIISCAAGGPKLAAAQKAGAAGGVRCDYVEQSGTSMAAPHVSGVIAAFLSIRPEFVGKAEAVKQIFVSTATDLKRDRYFQGAGLVDLMRAIQSV